MSGISVKLPGHAGMPARKPGPPPVPPHQAARRQQAAGPSGRLPPATQPVLSAAEVLLRIQSEVIDATTPAELAFVAANAPRSILRAQQIVVLQRDKHNAFRVKAVSSVTHVDRTSPAVLWFESMVFRLGRKHGLARPCSIPATAFGGGYQSFGNGYPLGHLMWIPWLDRDDRVVAGLLALRSMPWTEAEAGIAGHLAPVLAHAWTAVVQGKWQLPRAPRLTRTRKIVAMLALPLVLAVPVPMTALAPVEVAPRNPSLVTSGIDGVVSSVLVDPNAPVVKGQSLVQLNDTTFRNRFEIAEREVSLAETKYKKAAQLAFVDARGRHELGLARSELALKIAERNYAFDLLSRTLIKAERDGVAFYGAKRDLVGRPVGVGERLMEIASPSQIEFRIDLGVSDAIVLKDDARVKIFLDSAPLNPIDARLVRTSYQARSRENQQLAYSLVAEAKGEDADRLRLGVRGTAQVYGDLVPLGYYLFRRPIAAARQWLGL